VKKTQSKNRQVVQANASEQPKKEADARIKLPIQVVDAIYTKL
jgi:hypothetical protein